MREDIGNEGEGWGRDRKGGDIGARRDMDGGKER